MASVSRFKVDPIELQEEIKRRDDRAESIRRVHFIAARNIQAWIRGVLTRNHLRLLHLSAISIQRHWRGYRARIFTDRYLVMGVHRMWQDYYNRMATKIQATWRGYRDRKTTLDLPKMQRWLENVYAKNNETVEKMKKYRRDEIEYAERVMEHESMQWVLFILFKLHHLLRTKQRPGVMTRIDKCGFTFIEEMLKCFEFRRYTRRKITCCRDCRIDPKPSLVFRGTYYEKCEREIREFERNLQAGGVPIFRSHPYEEQEQMTRKLNKLYLEAMLHNRFETTSSSVHSTEQRDTSRSKRESDLRHHCTRTNGLYDEIKKMDCHLNRLRIKCPIHERAYST